MPDIAAAIRALTADELERDGVDVTTTAPLLDRSISRELFEISRALGGSRRLDALGHAIDEALLALAEGDGPC